MSGHFDADAYKRNSLPKTFYRVTYPGSQARDEDTGDYVSDTNLEISDNLHLKQVAENHFYWRREPSPFVSVFSDKKHALNWAYRRVDRLNCGLDEVYISKIDTAKLPLGTRVFDATFLVGVLDIYHPSPQSLNLYGKT
ncbi:hypothetical protein BBK36DRAFT_1157830 [Trichoderma citrinoviride]|uniref:DUF7587 domain-containing protein n=1 Tax=Trichoderma citrinoviride TaxID=58853 RepID=A0A2T4BFV6_9HYPO|nr:hypothetical protein BBK36DRAFT_1157830 [Trichoderma citrinoviride]PTB68158.1 hypothetical protein BBK36DRAFT_1157830 [Trichoderma citrinoviride]